DAILLPDRISRRPNVAFQRAVVVARHLLKRGVEVTRTMAQRMSTAEARKDFANLLRSSAAGERIKLTRYNKTVAVLISKRDLDELEECQRRHREAPKVRDGHTKTRSRIEKPAKRPL
ncbi:MAG: type II toxin-antitoxin system prevent-host-death family antitoxin, partial [Polyangia bacterium]